MFKNAVRSIRNSLKLKWSSYKYRFIPWISVNLSERTARQTALENDKVILDDDVCRQLLTLFRVLQKNDIGVKPGALPRLSERNHTHMYDVCGFEIRRSESSVADAGTGVFVTKGMVPKSTVVALYPGVIYRPSEPVLLQSIGNPFIFRCLDGILVDGNDKGVSRLLYKSCAQRDRVGPYMTCDMTWLTQHPVNPMAIGQYVNNQNKENGANVAYQEFDVPHEFSFHYRQFLPNVFYAPCDSEAESKRLLRTVVLVSLREILEGEELFSNYFTLVH